MKIYGIDFTSSPSKTKPIVCAECELVEDALELSRLYMFTTFEMLETFLETPAPWCCGIDAPFSQPRKLIEDLARLGYFIEPLEWQSYVQTFAAMGKAGFVNCLNDYRMNQPTGQKEHLREVDKVAKAISPMKLYGVPVGKMFFELAPRLAKTSLNIPVLCPTKDKRTVLEVYPSLVARSLIGRQSYKSDTKEQQTDERRTTRVTLMKMLESSQLQERYGLSVKLNAEQRKLLVDDAKGDTLDALLAALQTAWAFRQKDFGFPDNVDGLEGWIADPTIK